MTGSRHIQSPTMGHNQVLVMRVDEEGREIWMQQVFTGYTVESILVDGNWVVDSIPWDQEAYDMIITPMPHITYLITGYRDVSLVDATTPPGLFLMEVTGLGIVKFDSLYYNNNLHHIAGRCIQPAIGGGYIIACSYREEGGGIDQTLLTTLVKDKEGNYVHEDMPFYKVIPVGESGYSRWIRQFGNGYLLGGSAFRSNSKFDLFLQKIDVDYNVEWTRFFGDVDSDEFSDALVSGEGVYLAGSAGVKVPGTSYFRDQIYVVRTDTAGEVVWEHTYGGPTRHYASKILRSGDGDLLVAGTAYDQSMHTEMVLLKIDAETGDSLWMQSYGDFQYAGIRDAILTSDFGYVVAGRASQFSSQDPRVYVMKLDNSSDRTSLLMEREGLGLEIIAGTPVQDVISVSGDLSGTTGLTVTIDSLIHPSVGDLEISLEHAGVSSILVNRPEHSGENMLRTTLADVAETPVEAGYAPYTGLYRPFEPLLPFLNHLPIGDWTLTVTDYGGAGKKSTNRVLEGWSLNLLTEAGSGTGFAEREALTGFGLENVRPNPVGSEAMIRFSTSVPGKAEIRVYNSLGQPVDLVAREHLEAGKHERVWHRGSLAPGAYFIQLESRGMISIRKVILQ